MGEERVNRSSKGEGPTMAAENRAWRRREEAGVSIVADIILDVMIVIN